MRGALHAGRGAICPEPDADSPIDWMQNSLRFVETTSDEREKCSSITRRGRTRAETALPFPLAPLDRRLRPYPRRDPGPCPVPGPRRRRRRPYLRQLCRRATCRREPTFPRRRQPPAAPRRLRQRVPPVLGAGKLGRGHGPRRARVRPPPSGARSTAVRRPARWTRVAVGGFLFLPFTPICAVRGGSARDLAGSPGRPGPRAIPSAGCRSRRRRRRSRPPPRRSTPTRLP